MIQHVVGKMEVQGAGGFVQGHMKQATAEQEPGPQSQGPPSLPLAGLSQRLNLELVLAPPWMLQILVCKTRASLRCLLPGKTSPYRISYSLSCNTTTLVD